MYYLFIFNNINRIRCYFMLIAFSACDYDAYSRHGHTVRLLNPFHNLKSTTLHLLWPLVTLSAALITIICASTRWHILYGPTKCSRTSRACTPFEPQTNMLIVSYLCWKNLFMINSHGVMLLTHNVS